MAPQNPSADIPACFRIDRRGTVDSTNNAVKAALEAGEPHGYVCRASEQTGGYGRQGRSWSSPCGGSYQSVLLRPHLHAAQLPSLALVVALAVRSAALEVTGAESDAICVKWPNDVLALCDGAYAKLAGISCELHAGGVCVGIGVNVLRPDDACGAGTVGTLGTGAPAHLSEIGGGAPAEDAADAVGDAVLRHLAVRYEQWLECGFAPFAGQFDACNHLQGRAVHVTDIHGKAFAHGIVQGVDEEGRLLLRSEEDVHGTPGAHGSILRIASGEAHIGTVGD